MMKSNQNFTIVYILLAVAQMVICNYFRISLYVYVTILPAMILCIPLKINTALSMLIAFVTGLGVDVLAEGIIGINTLALVPVAFVRIPLLRAAIGNEASGKEEYFSLRTAGPGKSFFVLAAATCLFLAIYITADGSGARPFWFNAARFAASAVCDSILAIFIVKILRPEE